MPRPKRPVDIKRHHITIPDAYWNTLVNYTISSGQRMSVSSLMEGMLQYFVETYLAERLAQEQRPELASDWEAAKHSVDTFAHRIKLGG
jgi:hypothetical protein